MADRFIILLIGLAVKKENDHLDILLRNGGFSNNRYCILGLTSDVKRYVPLFYVIAQGCPRKSS